jgi:hypothetical protein
MKYEEFEQQLMGMLLSGDDELLEKLRRQYQTAKIESVDRDPVGFFTRYSVPHSEVFFIDRDSFAFGDVFGSVGGVDRAVGFVLFVRDGYISLLEGYTNLVDKWPQSYDEISLSYSTGSERDMEDLRRKWRNNPTA